MAAELSKNNSQITTLNECADSVSVSHHGPSSMHQAVVLFLGRGRDTSYISVCSGSLYGRPPPPAVQVNCQHDLWRRELSLDGLLNLPRDELVPSAHVTVVCFLHWPIFIHANKLNLPCFCFVFSPPPFSLFFPRVWPAWQLPETWDWQRGVNFTGRFLPPRLWYERYPGF